MTVAVVTDASAAIGADRMRSEGLFVLPLHILTKHGEIIDDGSPIPAEAFVAEGITTSGPSPAEVRQVLESAAAAGGEDGVVAVTMSTHLSSTYSTTSVQAAELGAPITVIDSRRIDMAMGFGVLEAARAARAGADRDAVAAAARAVVTEAEGFFCAATLEHLRAGGRVSAVAALLGGALSIVPVLRLGDDGRIETVRKTRTVRRARDQVATLAAAHAGEAPTRMAVHHVGVPDAADALADLLRERVPDLQDLVVGPFGGTISAHLGPGAVGVSVAPCR
ncbi:DegV family protein [Tsukamurella sp. 8F]|uniref:DegV family protein n=1 Tax=unclassified Tsukamurella TaxID=2633480 RepID=UPI0023B95F0A|nr:MULTISPECIES: DegV family protein [unclassified Tsukamurella]MDF0532244.1 DegV family protein [Tsukamurella sp. 8J]MDF0588056.1 DegV family protein [Tsukamurella sp. 8F]